MISILWQIVCIEDIEAIKLPDRAEELLAAIAPLAIDSVARPRLFDPISNE
jgi:hypothetical protein